MAHVALYAGSFDPFHKGHQSLLDDAACLFDSIRILIAENPAKPFRTFSVGTTMSMICDFVGDRQGYEPGMMKGTPGQAAADMGAVLLRGIRSVTDMDFEQRLATFNKEQFGVQTIFLFARPELSHVNSTAIRELMRLGLDYGRYL